MNKIQNYLEQIVSISKPIRNPEIKYAGIADLILHYGKPYTAITQHNYKYGQKKHCFNNSFRLATRHDLIYCEGFAINKIVDFPLEHAWCIDQHENVIDPTWDDGIEYYGVAFSRKFIVDLALKTGYAGVFGELSDLRFYVINGFNQSDLYTKNPIN